MLTLILSVLSLFSAQVRAGVVHQSTLFKNVSYQCSAKSLSFFDIGDLKISSIQLTADLKRQFESVVSVGLKNLSRVNPALSTKAVRALETKKLIVDCRRSTLGGLAERIVNPHGAGDEIHMGELTEDLIFLRSLEITSTPEFIEQMEEPGSEGYFRYAPVFHEFLHFADFDNLPVAEHNLLYKNGKIGSRDLVYACTAAALPNGSRAWFSEGNSLAEAKRFCARFLPEEPAREIHPRLLRRLDK